MRTETATNSKDKIRTKSVVDIKDLSISFGKQLVLNKLSLQLFENENLVVLGKSGSGKSVFIKCLVGLLIPDSGSITVLEKDVVNLDKLELALLRQKIGFLFQSGALYDSMTVRENLEFPLRRIKKDLSEAEIKDKVTEVLENVGLVESLDKMPSQLSGGMIKRVSLARTIIIDPQIMLYDEPTAGLDPVTSNEISSLILEVQKKYKTSSIIITHDIKCAMHTANRMVMLDKGKVYKEGTKEEFERTDDEVIQSFFK